MRTTMLIPRDRKKIAAFLGQILEKYKTGELTKNEAVGTLSYVMTALDTNNNLEALNWIEHGRRPIRVKSKFERRKITTLFEELDKNPT